jgi:DNA primase
VAGRIRDDDIAEVREKARIDDVVSGYVTLKRAGGGSYKGLCPFHDEKTPSFNVNPARQFFHCFGCGEGGDVISSSSSGARTATTSPYAPAVRRGVG